MSATRIRWTMPIQRARLLRDLLGAVEAGRDAVGWRAVAQSLLGELQRAMDATTPRSRAKLPALPFAKPDPGERKARRRSAEEEHEERMRIIRDALAKRVPYDISGPLCERCGFHRMADPHHLFGRGKGNPLESERNCLGLCRSCHERAQHQADLATAAVWWSWVVEHLTRLGFAEEAAMAGERLQRVLNRQAVTRAGEGLRHG